MDKKIGTFVNSLEGPLLAGSHIVGPNEKVLVEEYMESHPQWDAFFRDAQHHIAKGHLVEPKKAGTAKKEKAESGRVVQDARAFAHLTEAEVDSFLGQQWKTLQKAVEEIDDKAVLLAYLDGALRLGKSQAVISALQKRINTLDSK